MHQRVAAIESWRRAQVDPTKIVWTPYSAEREYAMYRN